jgi:hypothetical protein
MLTLPRPDQWPAANRCWKCRRGTLWMPWAYLPGHEWYVSVYTCDAGHTWTMGHAGYWDGQELRQLLADGNIRPSAGIGELPMRYDDGAAVPTDGWTLVRWSRLGPLPIPSRRNDEEDEGEEDEEADEDAEGEPVEQDPRGLRWEASRSGELGA